MSDAGYHSLLQVLEGAGIEYMSATSDAMYKKTFRSIK